MITAALRRAILAAAESAAGSAAGSAARADADPLLTPGPAPGSYATSLPFRLSRENPGRAAADLAARLLEPPWIAAALGPCWPAHDLCLYALDILSGLWSALYLQPSRDTALLSAQAEYQARILPALVAQLTTETSTCGHRRFPTPDQPWSAP